MGLDECGGERGERGGGGGGEDRDAVAVGEVGCEGVAAELEEVRGEGCGRVVGGV